MSLTTNKTKNYNKSILFAVSIGFFVLFYIVYCSQLKKEFSYVFVELKPFQTVTGWGYEITANGKTYIRQSFIPAVAGKESFKTKAEAILVGNKVIDKIKHGQQFPTISIEELRQMGVLKDSSQ